ncbi:MAG TPA: hypothetical protein VHW64_19955 [Nocardioides sp.]|uniref:hypothetical protein n=1 Tax=Nocardioides sp. TaxID=35761 RepID=UPI002E36FFB6|nr:hypothetical protein [Nocardioides sp.]HEX3932971.1 hypothetical protein [Nocardioides sp.]
MTNDPASMRAAAARLRSGADGLTASSNQVDTQVGTVTFQGPAGDHFRVETIGGVFDLRSASVRMQELADRLVREADRLEQQQLAEQRQGGCW